MQTNEPAQPAPTRYYVGHGDAERHDRVVGYDLMAAHGWEFLLDNLLEDEGDRGEAVKHAAVLGEN